MLETVTYDNLTDNTTGHAGWFYKKIRIGSKWNRTETSKIQFPPGWLSLSQ